MTPVHGFPAYGLARDPFELAVLDPLARPDDKEIVSIVDGWHALVDAKKLIKAKVADKSPVYFVVEGASQTGRTSIANYLVYLWAREHGAGPGPDPEIIAYRRDRGSQSGTYLPADQIRDWIVNFYGKVLRDDRFITEIVTDRILELDKSPIELTTHLPFALALRGLEVDLLNAQGGTSFQFAAIMEHGKGRELVQMVKDSFSLTRAIVVVTVDQSDDSVAAREDIDKTLGEDGLRILLGTVQGADVAEVVARRWNGHRPGVESPFDAAAVAKVFDRHRPIARTFKILSIMLALQQFKHGDQFTWPATEPAARHLRAASADGDQRAAGAGGGTETETGPGK